MEIKRRKPRVMTQARRQPSSGYDYGELSRQALSDLIATKRTYTAREMLYELLRHWAPSGTSMYFLLEIDDRAFFEEIDRLQYEEDEELEEDGDGIDLDE
jgi:hypothetical protein